MKKTKTQEISRKDLATIYKSNICEGWKKKIAEVLVDNIDEEIIEVSNEQILAAHKEADGSQKKLIEKYFNIIVEKKLTDQIKTWVDVCKHLNIKEKDILPYANPKNKIEKSVNAFVKIQKISEVLNDGWIPNFSNSEYKYYPYFQKAGSYWVVCSYRYWAGTAAVGSGFYFKSSELALYAANTFLDIYTDYLPA